MKNELIQKLRLDQPLTLEESLELDTLLEESSEVASWLSPSPNSEPSLAWRSRLNEQLITHAPKPKAKLRWGRVPQLASLAATLAFATFSATSYINSRGGSVPASSEGISPEELMISAHLQNNFSAVVATPSELPTSNQEANGTIHWSPEELSTY